MGRVRSVRAVEGDDGAGAVVEVVAVARGAVGEVVAGDGFEAEDGAAGPDASEAGEEPFAEIECRARHGDVVVVRRVIFEAVGLWIEVVEGELARRRAEECVLFVNGLEGRNVRVGEADRGDDGGQAAASADVDDAKWLVGMEAA